MDKMDGLSLDLEKENINKIKELFPEAVEEGKINFDMLRAFLGDEVDDSREKYQFTWNGKAKSIKLAQTPSSATLRPCKEESKNWHTTENLYIEGDNLEVLKQLQKTYYGKIKMIYIDPPYNTGKDFVYKDSFSNSLENYKEQTSQASSSNPETSGRFHTNWLNMMYPRLILAKNLLSNDGVIFISIDDNEQVNLKQICDEIFGENNFIACIVVEGTPKNDPYVVSTAHEYSLVYARNMNAIKENGSYGLINPIYTEIENLYFLKYKDNPNNFQTVLKEFYEKNDLTNDNIANYKYADEYGVYRIGPIDDPQSSGPKDLRINPKTGNYCKVPSSGWRCTLDTWNQWLDQHLINFPDDDTTLPSKKTYIEKNRLDVMRAYFKIQTRKDSDYLKRLFDTPINIFSNPKPVELISTFIRNCNDRKMLILDFFSGSATTFHAAMKVNKEDGGNRKCILVQIPEIISPEGAKSSKEKKICKTAIDFLNSIGKPATICEIGKERIRRAGEQIKAEWEKEHPSDGLFASEETFNTDIGFKVFKLGSTNLIPWDNSEKYNEVNLYNLNNLFKEDRNNEDVLYEIMLKYGVFDKQVEEIEVNGKTMYRVGKRYMIVCLDNSVTSNDIKAIGELSPRTVIFKESGFIDDNAKINAVYNLEKAGVEDVKCI